MRKLGNGLLVILLAIAVNLGLFGLTSVLSQVHKARAEEPDAVAVSLVTLVLPAPPEREEAKEPEPPKPDPQPDFAPDLLQPSVGDFAGPAVSVNIDLGGTGARTRAADVVFDSVDLDQAPQPLVKTPPQYPRRARERGIEGLVAVKILVTNEGTVRQVVVLKSRPPEVFDDAVRKALPGWRFEPGKIGGEPVTAWVTTTIRFDLQN